LTIILNQRSDLSLTAFYRVAWQGENVRIAPAALERIAAARASFLELIDKDPSVVIYGVTTAMGERASQRLTQQERDVHARLKPFAAATSFGDHLPDRTVRGIVFARLANFIEGNAATTPRLAQAVAQMLDGGPMPRVSVEGQGGAGEILALYPLFAELSKGFDLEVKERGSLINGSPCAAALLADAAIAARRRLQLVLETFALSIEAFRAPLEHYDEALEQLWGDPDEAAVLRSLRGYLSDVGGRRNYQAPVSYRIVPRILGHAHRAVSSAERAASASLASVSDNPVYLPPDAAHRYGRCISTGGYHNAWAAPALDDLAGVWADICALCGRHGGKLLNGHVSHLPDQLLVGRQSGQSDGHGNIGYVTMALDGYIEQAKGAAQRTFIPGDSAASAQDDVGAPAFLAWSKEARAARCLDAALAILAVLASQALFVTDRPAPRALGGFVELVRSCVPPVIEDRVLGPELGRLTDAIRTRIFAPSEKIDSSTP
jgi:histidine ammonia-lyase